MHKIIVRRSCIMITNYTMGDCTKIEFTFRIYERITHSYYYMGMYYDEEDKILYLSRGVDVWFVEQCFGCQAHFDNSCYHYASTGDLKLKVAPRDERQKEILRFCLGLSEYREIKDQSQYSVNANPGFGKTYISMATASYFEIKPIIITYSVSLLTQWKERIAQYNNINPKEILLISGAAAINKLLKTKDTSKYKVYMITHSTIKSYATTYGWKAIGELMEHLEIGIKVYDEAHLNFNNITMIDFHTNVYKTYYLTATPARSSEDENNIYNMYFKNIVSINLFDDIVDPHTKYIALKFNSNPTVFDLSDCRNAYGLDRNRYMEYLACKDEYWKILTIVMDLVLKIDGKCLIYIGTNNVILKTFKWLNARYPELAGDIGIFTTIVTKEEKEISKTKRIILSTTKSAAAGMDIDNLKATVVLNEPFKSHVTAQQSLGRTRADNTYYIDCVDIGFNYLRKYYTYKRPIFEKYSTGCSEINMKPHEVEFRYNKITEQRVAEFVKPLITMIPQVPQPLVTFY